MSKYSIPNQTDEYIKQLSKDIYNDKIFTSYMIPENQREAMLKMVFMPLLFLGPQKPFTSNVGKAESRENRIWELLDEDDEIEDYNKNFLAKIGIIYEYYCDENGSHNTFGRSINGMPSFQSFRVLNIEDTDKLRDYYEQYSKIREEADNF